jgi:Zn-dependent protease with chaperone function
MASSSAVKSRSPGLNDITDLERQGFFRLTVWKRNFFLTLAVLLELLVLGFIMALHVNTSPLPETVPFMGYHVHLAFDSWQTYFWLFVVLLVQIGLGYHQLYKSLEGKDMTQLYPEDKSGDRKFGGFTGKELADMVHELAGYMKVGCVRWIVINDRPDPNAYTAHILGVGNIVVLHSNLLEIMPPEGVRAVVAHEVGHIRRKDSLVYLLASIPGSFMFMLGLVILWRIGIGIFWFENLWVLVQRVLFVGMVWALAGWVLVRLHRLANRASQQSEHLADAYAAQVCGWGPTLNALLLLGERAEAVHAVMNTLQKQPHLKGLTFTEEHLVRILKRLPPRELDENKARHLAPRLYIEERLAELRDTLCVPLSDEEIVELARRADQDLRNKQAEEAKVNAEEVAKQVQQEKEKEAELEKLLIDWRKFDWDRSGHLDVNETAALVAELRTDTRRMIFRQFLEPEAEWESHPTMRGRLLFLYDAFERARTKS